VEEHTSNRGTVFIQLVIAIEFAKKATANNKGCTNNKVLTGCDSLIDLKVARESLTKPMQELLRFSLCSRGLTPVTFTNCRNLL